METIISSTNTFARDVITGLESHPKHLPSKYFYDEVGDKIFQEIMDMPEYYVCRAEMEIFQTKARQIAHSVAFINNNNFDVIELGAGDATKSIHLLKALMEENWAGNMNTLPGTTGKFAPTPMFQYFPTDISHHAIDDLHQRLPDQLPGVRVLGIVGEYMEALKSAYTLSPDKPKLILFIGSSIGNFTVHETKRFFHEIHKIMKPGDYILTGFDLMTGYEKTPEVILSAYNDSKGITKRFNMNLLTRINKTLGANFDITKFDHTPTYNPQTGECKSYIKSLEDQTVRVGELPIHFKKDELIYTEISQKYTHDMLDTIAMEECFSPLFSYNDSKGWYTDELWEAR